MAGGFCKRGCLSRVQRSTLLPASSGTFDWHIWWILAKSWRHFSCMMVSSLVSLPSIQKQAMFVKFLVFYRKKILRTWLVSVYWVWVCVTTQYTETYQVHRIFFSYSCRLWFFSRYCFAASRVFHCRLWHTIKFRNFCSRLFFCLKSAAFQIFCQVMSICDRKKFTPRKELILF